MEMDGEIFPAGIKLELNACLETLKNRFDPAAAATIISTFQNLPASDPQIYRYTITEDENRCSAPSVQSKQIGKFTVCKFMFPLKNCEVILFHDWSATSTFQKPSPAVRLEYDCITHQTCAVSIEEVIKDESFCVSDFFKSLYWRFLGFLMGRKIYFLTNNWKTVPRLLYGRSRIDS